MGHPAPGSAIRADIIRLDFGLAPTLRKTGKGLASGCLLAKHDGSGKHTRRPDMSECPHGMQREMHAGLQHVTKGSAEGDRA